MRSYEARRAKVKLIALVLAVLSVLLAVVALGLGAAQLPLSTVLDTLIAPISGQQPSGTGAAIVLGVRLPRVISSYLVGMALAVCGACMQGLFQNPMADPHLLGVSSGAALGAALAAVLGAGAMRALTGTFAFAFAIGAVLLVMLLARVRGRISTLNLILAGVAVSALLSALTSALVIINRDSIEDVYLWTMGSFTASSWSKLSSAAPILILGSAAIMAFSRELNAMLLGEAEARQLGVQVRHVRVILLGLGTLVTACAVSISGVIGFVGLMVPHGMRMLCGPDHRGLMPLSALAGGAYLLLMDTLARTVLMPIEIPIGVLTALVGGPFFLYLMRRRNNA